MKSIEAETLTKLGNPEWTPDYLMARLFSQHPVNNLTIRQSNHHLYPFPAKLKVNLANTLLPISGNNG